jgi:CRISPR-associated protein Cas1
MLGVMNEPAPPNDIPALHRPVPALVPARMLNEHTYCPRLAYLEWVQGDFADSSDTVDGRWQHRNVDKERGALPEPERIGDAAFHARSLSLSAPGVGLVARIDLVEADGDLVTPVDYKRGKAPDIPGEVYEPERVQLCAQALVLEENGYRVERGVIYFVASRQRVEVPIDEALRARTRELLAELRVSAARAEPPPPLVDSPKCPRCSLVGICLPDEINLLRADEPDVPVRRLVPARDDALPLYVQTSGTRIGRRGDELHIEPRDGEKLTARFGDISQVVLFGHVQITTQALHELFDRGIATCFLSAGGWFHGLARGMDHKNVELRRRQFAMAADPAWCLTMARRLVAAKIRNCRTLARRNAEALTPGVADRLRDLAAVTDETGSLESLLGIEGTAARLYFGEYGRMVRPPAKEGAPAGMTFDFDGRNRRPPRDPVNALLSLGYALLTKDVTIKLLAVGFDPYLGFYHQPRYGRPALALDIMEEFRPLIVDSAVLTAINTGVIQAGDFIRRGGAVALTQAARARFISAYERRMDEEITHPLFGYRVSYRRILEVQIRLLARHLGGELAEYPPFLTR